MKLRTLDSMVSRYITLEKGEHGWYFDYDGLQKLIKNTKTEKETEPLRAAIRDGKIKPIGFDEDKGVSLFWIVEIPTGISVKKSIQLSEALHGKTPVSSVEDKREELLDRMRKISTRA